MTRASRSVSVTPFRSGTGRHRKPGKESCFTRASATGIVLAATASVLYGGQAARAAAPDAPAPRPGASGEEPEEPTPVAGSHIGLVVIDNSYADSWLEIDRTLDTLLLSAGTAGSDHESESGD
ncbi:hypothetical protein ABZ370_06380 [Streptomyces sp. NPDC005962]|uniref:hypothetical protein n=1 Tax=Streptomyces sp. NPDC005962 TaxID=3154466 RepID=UPI0033CAB821